MAQVPLPPLLSYVRRDGRVCPKPWHELHRMLGRVAPPPLILAAYGAPNWQKAQRLREQIVFAAEHGLLPQVDRYLRSLAPEDWIAARGNWRGEQPLIFKLLDQKPRRIPAQLSFAFW